jgi:hypothetical protein
LVSPLLTSVEKLKEKSPYVNYVDIRALWSNIWNQAV